MRRPREMWSRARRLSRPRRQPLGAHASVVSYGTPRPGVVPLDSEAWLVGRPAARRGRLVVDELDAGTWLVRRRGKGARTVRHLGPARLPADLVLDERAVRRRMGSFQVEMLHYLAEEHIAWILRELQVNCVLDVGANRGQYAKKLRRAGYTGRIVSFDPLAEVAEILEREAAADPHWHVHRIALGDSDADAEMMVAGGEARMSSLRSSSEFGKSWSHKLDTDTREAVRVRRLDGIYDELIAGIDQPRVYLKLDTQGYDLQAFEGAGDRVRAVVGMQSEVSSVPIYDGVPRLTEQLEVYESAGFELSGMFPVIVDRPTLRVIEFDAVMVRVDALPSRDAR